MVEKAELVTIMGDEIGNRTIEKALRELSNSGEIDYYTVPPYNKKVYRLSSEGAEKKSHFEDNPF